VTTRRRLWPFLMAVLLNSCGGSQSAPSNLQEGIVIYVDPKFEGPSLNLTTDAEDLDDIRGPCTKGTVSLSGFNFDDCISSIRIVPGWSAIVYEDPKYRGASVTITSDVADLDNIKGPCGDDFDDCTSSIRVVRSNP
jgi:hypothetical protein